MYLYIVINLLKSTQLLLNVMWRLYITRSFKTSGDAFRLPYSIVFDCSIRPFPHLSQSSLYISQLSRFLEDGLVSFFLHVSSYSQFLVIALGPISRHDHTKWVVFASSHPISYLARYVIYNSNKSVKRLKDKWLSSIQDVQSHHFKIRFSQGWPYQKITNRT